MIKLMSDYLEVCKSCGWHGGFRHVERGECWPIAGAAADGLIALIRIPATKLGYGHGALTFEFNDDCHLTLRFNEDGSFLFEDLFFNKRIGVVALCELVTAIGSAASDTSTQGDDTP